MGKKEIIRSITLAVSILAICATVLLLVKKVPPLLKKCPPAGKVLVEQSFLDSLKAVAEMPPEVRIDTVIIVKDTAIYTVKNNPSPIFWDEVTEERVYEDSLKMIDDGIDAWVKIKTRGVVDQIIWGYHPVYKYITKDSIVYKPYPVEQIKEISDRGLYAIGGLGGSPGGVGISAGLMWKSKNRLMYGAEIAQMKNTYIMVKVAYKLF